MKKLCKGNLEVVDLKRVLSVILSVTMLFICSTNMLILSEADVSQSNLFVQTTASDTLYLADNYGSLNLTDIIIPDSFNGNPITKVNLWLNITSYLNHPDDTTVTSLTYGKNISNTSSFSTATGDRYELARFRALKTVKYLYDGAEFVLQSNLAYKTGYTTNNIEEVYIYATGISSIGGANVFRGFPSNLKIYVTSEEIKQQIYDTCKSSTYYPVTEDQIIVMQSTTPSSSAKLNCDGTNYGIALKPSVEVTVDSQPVENPTVTYQLYTDEACQNRYDGYAYDSGKLPVGTYYLRATVAGTDDYTGSVSNVVKVEVSKNDVPDDVIEALNNAITAANNFKEENVADDYDSAVWSSVFSTSVSTNALPQAEIVAREVDGGLITEDRVIEVTKNLNDALDALKSAVIKPVDEKTALENVIKDAESRRESGKYTEESLKALTDEIAKAKEVFESATATKTQVINATNALQKAIDNLVEVKPEEANDYVNLQGTWKKQGGTDNKMNSLKADTKYSLGDWWIEITNLDLSEMINPTLEVTYEANGDTTQIAANKSGSTGGTSDWDITITSGKDSSGVSTYSLDNEIKNLFITSNGNTMVYKKIRVFDAATDFTALKEAIKAGEAVDLSKYTDETVNALTQAIESGKAVLENAKATQVETDDATQTINNAIKALTEKPTDPEPTKPSVTPSNPTKPTTKPVVTTAPTTRSSDVVAKDKASAEKAMKQAKITKLKVKSKAKKKINVTWKKVKKAKGYEVQVSTKKTFKKSKIVYDKFTSKKKLTIKNKKFKSGKKYYVRVRAYATYKDANNTPIKVYSNWNKKLRTVKVK